MHNGTVDNQHDINNSEVTKIGEIKNIEILVQSRYRKVYILDSMGDILQDEIIKIFWIMIKRMMNILRKFCH